MSTNKNQGDNTISQLKEIIDDPNISDTVKASLIPEISKIAQIEHAKIAPAWQKVLRSGPAVAAIASIITLGITKYVDFLLANKDSENKADIAEVDRQHTKSLERQKFEFELVRVALDENQPEARVERLEFLVDIGLLQDLNKEKIKKYTEPGSKTLPEFHNSSYSPAKIKQLLYRETISIISSLIGQTEPIKEDSFHVERFWQLYRKDLIGIESKEVASAMVQFGAELKNTYGSTATDELKSLSEAVIKQIRKELGEEIETGEN